jgi:hypothetical protein
MLREFTPEEEILLCCARTRLETQTVARVCELIEGGVDWNRLIALARRHFLTQLLYVHLDKQFEKMVPAAFMQELQREFRANVYSNLKLAGELLRLLRLFETDGIPVIALKGPVFAVSVYKDIALRTFGDLDILIQKRDIPRVTKTLESAGYVPLSSGCRAKDALQYKILANAFINAAHKDVVIEVHWGLLKPQAACKLDVADAFGRARLTPFFNKEVNTLSPEELLLFSCIHAIKHSWGLQLNWICDIAEIVRALSPIDWDNLFEKARRAHGRRMLDTGLLAAAELLGAPVPAQALHRIRSDRSVDKLVAEVKRRLFEENEMQFMTYVRTQIAMKERLADKLKIFLWWALVPSVGDSDRWCLPSQLIGLYFVIHPLRCALTVGLTVLGAECRS